MMTFDKGRAGGARSILLVAVLAFVIAVCAIIGWPFGGRGSIVTTVAPSAREAKHVEAATPTLAKPREEADLESTQGDVGHRSSTQGTATERTSTAPLAAASKSGPLTVRGTVLDFHTRKPIPGATVESDREGDRRSTWSSASSSATGDFEIPGVEPGLVALRVSAPGYVTAKQSVLAEKSALPPPIEITLVSDQVITVRLLGADGRPLGEWCRALLPSDDNHVVDIVETREPNAKRVERKSGVRIGSVTSELYLKRDWTSNLSVPVHPPYPLHVSACFVADARDEEHFDVIATERVESAGAVVQFTIPADVFLPELCTVRVCVADLLTGAPIPESRVGLIPRGTFGTADHVVPENGCVRFDGMRRGAYSLTIYAEGREWFQEDVTVEKTDTDLGVYSLAPSTMLAGQVLDENGTVAGVNVFTCVAKNLDRAYAARSSFAQTTGPDGAFELHGIGRGSYLVRAQGAGWAPIPAIVDTSAGDVKNLVVRTTHGVEVHFMVGEPMASGTLCFTDARDLPVAERDLSNLRELTQQLAPGRYTWRVDVDDRRGDAHKFTVGDQRVELGLGR